MKWLFGIVYCLLLACIVGLSYYLTCDYDSLRLWYLDNYGHMYNSHLWSTRFFTPDVKTQGDFWAICGIFVLLILGFILYRFGSSLHRISWKNAKIKWEKSDTWSISIVLFLSIFIYRHIPPAYDEVFSAAYFIEKDIFHTLSYYPLPNNHIFFNVLSHVLFWITNDGLLAGRLVSLLGFLFFLYLLRFHIFETIRHSYLRSAYILATAATFPVMAFMVSARGYMILLSISILAWITYEKYLKNAHQKYLILHIISHIIGMWVVPSYLYVLVGFMILWLISYYEKNISFKRLFLLGLSIICGIFVVHLPLLLFSGIASWMSNKYVAVTPMSSLTFIRQLYESHYFIGFGKEWFISPWLGLLIIVFLWVMYVKNKYDKRYIRSIMVLLLTFLTFLILHHKIPFYRNLIMYGLWLWIGFLIALHRWVDHKKWNLNYLATTVVLWSIYSLYYNYNSLPDNIYYYDQRATYDRYLSHAIDTFIRDKSVLITDESFYWYAVIPKSHDIRYGGYPDDRTQVWITHDSISVDHTRWHPSIKFEQSHVFVRK
jgi:hypothetical protein